MIREDTTQTPIVVFIENEISVTIRKFIVKMPDGTVKNYTLKTTKEGKLLLN